MPTVAMAKGDREAFRAALKVLGNEESVKKGKVADRKPKPAKRAIVDKDGKGQKAGGKGQKASDEPGKSSAPKGSWKGTERRMPKRKPSSSTHGVSVANGTTVTGERRRVALADRLERFEARERDARSGEGSGGVYCGKLASSGAVRVPVVPSSSTRRGKYA